MLEKIVVISFIVFAIYATMMEGMIFGFVNDWWGKFTKGWDEEKAEYWSKPLFSCPICMTPYYGSMAFLLLVMLYKWDWKDSPLIIIGAMGLNTILVKLFPDKD